MCIRTALKATALCSLPGLAGFSAGMLSVEHPRVFLAALVGSLLAAGIAALRGYSRTGKGTDAGEVVVAAGVLLALSFTFSFWTGIAAAAGLGLLKPGVLVAASTALLAAWTLTFLRRVIERKVPWLEVLIQRFVPELDAPAYRERAL